MSPLTIIRKFKASYIASGLLFTGAMLLVLGVTIQGMWALANLQNEREGLMARISQARERSLETQFVFKKQVQEWKNVLLRGNDPDLFREYFLAFEAEEKDLKRRLLELRDALVESPKLIEEIDACLEVFEELGQSYRRALLRYDSEDPLSYARVDQLVRGIDRAPTELFDALVMHIDMEGARQLALSATEFYSKRERIVWTSVLSGGLGLILIFFNLTELHRRHKELLAAKESAEKAALIKGSFVANVSHEVRTPLNGIMGMTQMLESKDLDAESRSLVDTLQVSCNNLLRIVDDILDFSKLEAGKIAVEPLLIDRESFIREFDALFRPRAEAKGLRFEVMQSAKLPRKFESDPLRLTQIIGNFLDNAIKFTERGGRVRLSVNLVEEEHPRSDSLEFEVSDTGVGIRQGSIKSLFDPFTQEDLSTTRVYGGTGLGLSICAQLANLMNGGITVESEPNSGSKFRFTLPIVSRETELKPIGAARDSQVVEVGPESGEANEPDPELKILLVEDNKVNQKVVSLFLTKWNLEATVAGDGVEAIEIWRQKQPDVILMDLQMPRMGGMEATQTIRAESGSNTAPWIIALTAGATQSQRDDALARGFNDYLTKPLKEDRLREALLAVDPLHKV